MSLKVAVMNEIMTAVERLKPLRINELCYSYCEEPDLWKRAKPIYNKQWMWCHAANWYNLHEVTKRYGYSNALFSNRERASANVAYLGNLLIYDYDDGVTLDEMKSKIEQLGISGLIVTTLNHLKEKKGVTCDRFRLILQLEDCIGANISTNMMEDILQEVDKRLELGRAYDEACATIERYYAPSPIQKHYYIDGMTLDISSIIDEVKKPKPKPVPRPVQVYSNSGQSLREMREYIREYIPYNTVVTELEAKGLRVNGKGAIYLDRKHVGNIHPDTRMIADWADSEHLDIIGVLDKYYNESYVDNTKRLYEELR